MSKRTGRVIPFKRDVSFHMNRAEQAASRNNYYDMAYHYRMALQVDPNYTDARMLLAQLLTEFERYEDSVQLLYEQFCLGEPYSDILYALARNFYGLTDYENARKSCEQFRNLIGKDAKNPELDEFLELLSDEESLRIETGLYTQEEHDIARMILELSSAMLDEQYDYLGLRVLEHLKSNPESEETWIWKLYHAVATNNAEDAAFAASKLVDIDIEHVIASCYMAVEAVQAGRPEEGKKLLEPFIDELDAFGDEEALAVAVTYIAFQDYKRAMDILTPFYLEQVGDRFVAHQLARCRYFTGDKEGAKEIYHRLHCLDPRDMVAKHYLYLINKDIPQTDAPGDDRWGFLYRIPRIDLPEYRREFEDFCNEKLRQQRERWKAEPGTRDLVRYFLHAASYKEAKSIIGMLKKLGDAYANRLLRSYALRIGQSDGLKRYAMQVVEQLDPENIRFGNVGGCWISGGDFEQYVMRLPVAYRAMLMCLLDHVKGTNHQAVVQKAMDVFIQYHQSTEDELPEITDEEGVALAAALNYMGCILSKESIAVETILSEYGITTDDMERAIATLTGDKHEENT